MTKCFRCGNEVPQPNIKEAIARESDWRYWLDDHPTEALQTRRGEERVLICIPCADELDSRNEETDD